MYRLLHERPFRLCRSSKIKPSYCRSASFHGVRLYTDVSDSPHLDAHKINAEIYFGCAETDSYAPQEMVNSLDKYLEKTGIKYRIEW